jgi:integrase
MPRAKLLTPNFNLQKRADGYYDIRYTVDGKTKNSATGTKDYILAEAARARFSQEYRKPALSKRPTVGEICEAYMTYRMAIVAAPQQMPYAYAPIIRHLGSLFADSLTQTTVSGYAATRLKEPVARKGGRYGNAPVGEPTVSKELRSLRAALKWAHSEQSIEREPKFKIELSNGESREHWITQDEARKLVDSAAPHLALFIIIALGTAKRREAILSLTWDQVKLHLPGHETIDFGDDIGNKRRGLTAIAGIPRLVAALRAAKEAATSPYVIEYKGERVKDVKTAMAAACRRAGVADVSPHVLKHTAITWMVQGRMSFEQIAKFTKTSRDMIERVYGHHSPEFVAGVSEALAF